MSKELEALNKLQHDFGQLKGQELVSCYETIFNALNRLEAIDNANPSEALECLENMQSRIACYISTIEYATIKQALLKAQKEHKALDLLMQELDCKDFAYLRKYARCGYEKINKKYLKWEDLEFKGEEQTMKVILNGSVHFLSYYRNMFSDNLCMIDNTGITIWKENKQLFNDLHLERVEE